MRLLFLCLLSLITTFTYAQRFVEVKNGLFYQNEQPYFFIGANYWYGMNLGIDGSAGNRARLVRELDELQAMGVTNLRIMGASEGPDTEPYRMSPALQPAPGEYNEQVFQGLDFLLEEMRKRDMKAVVTLNDFWIWSGGMAQYIAWADQESMVYSPPVENTDWHNYQQHTSSFFNHKKANKLYRKFLKTIIDRTNTVSKVKYKDDPTIMSWQLGNEPRGYGNTEAYRNWIHETARFIQKKDKNHLVSIGSEGNTGSHHAGTNFLEDHRSEYIDYGTMHIWIENWSWYDPTKGMEDMDSAIMKATAYLEHHLDKSKELGKPLVLEEFGVARDNGSFEQSATTQNRDRFFDEIFQLVYKKAASGMVGCNFWCWSGEGRPVEAGGLWHAGDPLTGDPPHEKQGWYSVYDSDQSTIEVIEKYAELINALKSSSEVSLK
ncbi:glycoside hydrolase 5 family protein [Fulvivirga ligni]|uniref:glycoside hydrolase 5 family protein n=1 Tax=Fulvivirga ligni TaxID=2904246 RepID=UPI001F2FC31B|nr:cellulase family glycosylhydrolase [Fulvivirga ligni]UII19264.1 cellulase family glycosylhydrolase [Fulvivirga ligni]